MIWLLLCAQTVQNTETGEVLMTNIPQVESAPVSALPASERCTDYDNLINHYGRIYEVDPDLVKIVIDKESQYNPNAVSRSGAIGLMQLMPKTAEALGVEDAYNPGQNIEGGVKFLHNLCVMFDGDLELVLAAYHAGPGLVKRLGRVPDIPETIAYVDYILSRYDPARPKTVVVTITEDGIPLITNRAK
jgi:soluble lytic murein transglycosylase-like protein